MSMHSQLPRPARRGFAGAFVLAALMSLPFAPAQAQELADVSVNGLHPTSLVVRVAGLDAGAVRNAVRATSYTVCRNAALNRELDQFDVLWCADKTHARTMRTYRSAQSGPGETLHAAVPVIRVAAIQQVR